MSSLAFFIFIVCLIKRKMTRKIVNSSEARRNFTIKRIKKWKNSIEMIVNIHNKTLDFKILFGGYIL